MQFAIRAPQTITLADQDDKDAAGIQLNFSMNGADTSRVKLDIVLPDYGVHSLVFNKGGDEVERKFTPQGDDDTSITHEAHPGDYMEGGRDTRADNPYTHVAPVDADSAYRDAHGPVGFKQPVAPDDADDLRKQAMDEAASNAEKLRAEQRTDADLDPAEREQKAEDERRARVDETADRDADRAGRMEEVRNVPPFTGTDGQGRPANDPLIPPPSSPLPGSPAPQPESERNHGTVNRADGTTVQTENRPVTSPGQPSST